MPADQYAKVKNLPYTTPQKMLARSGSFGQAAMDGSTYYVRAGKKGIQYLWIFQSSQDQSSPEIQQFTRPW